MTTPITREIALNLLRAGKVDDAFPNELRISGLSRPPFVPLYMVVAGNPIPTEKGWVENQGHTSAREEDRITDTTTLDDKLRQAGTSRADLEKSKLHKHYSTLALCDEGYRPRNTWLITQCLTLKAVEKLAGMSYDLAQKTKPAEKPPLTGPQL